VATERITRRLDGGGRARDRAATAGSSPIPARGSATSCRTPVPGLRRLVRLGPIVHDDQGAYFEINLALSGAAG